MASVYLTPLHRAALEAVSAATGCPIEELKVDVPPNPKLGDLAVPCHPITRRTKVNPVEVAKDIVSKFVPGGLLASATAAGPFVNFRANRSAVMRWVIENAIAGALVPKVGTGKTICIDYSSPNISKELAFHHVRSTGIGHSLAQIFRALDYKVVGINHLGDWGTTHGMLIAAYKKWPPKKDEVLDIHALNELYVRWREHTNPLKHEDADEWIAKIAAGDEAARAALAAEVARCTAAESVARAWFQKLESGDEEARALWQRFKDVSWAEFESVYAQLGIQFEVVRGESAYEPDLARVMAELRAKNLVVESNGAQVVWLGDPPAPGDDNTDPPVIVEKSDGASTYVTRDYASAQYRYNEFKFDRSLYVVAREQTLHFKQVFAVLAKAGHAWASRCEHIPFGLVLMGGKKTSTRGGSGAMLRAVLNEAKARVITKLATTPSTTAMAVGAAEPLAQKIGDGAVLFANLIAQRDKDVNFEWEKALATTGDSGVYLQYAHARCASIMKKADTTVRVGEVDYDALATDGEWAVAKRMLEFGDIVARAGEKCEPHLVAHYLLDLAGDFARWYTDGNDKAELRVISADLNTRHARVALTLAVQTTMAAGLELLGVPHPDQM